MHAHRQLKQNVLFPAAAWFRAHCRPLRCKQFKVEEVKLVEKDTIDTRRTIPLLSVECERLKSGAQAKPTLHFTSEVIY